jgi:hypothetical protein
LLALFDRGAGLRFRRDGIRSTWRRVLQDDIGFFDFRAIYLVFEDVASICEVVTQLADLIDVFSDRPS